MASSREILQDNHIKYKTEGFNNQIENVGLWDHMEEYWINILDQMISDEHINPSMLMQGISYLKTKPGFEGLQSISIVPDQKILYNDIKAVSDAINANNYWASGAPSGEINNTAGDHIVNNGQVLYLDANVEHRYRNLTVRTGGIIAMKDSDDESNTRLSILVHDTLTIEAGGQILCHHPTTIAKTQPSDGANGSNGSNASGYNSDANYYATGGGGGGDPGTGTSDGQPGDGGPTVTYNLSKTQYIRGGGGGHGGRGGTIQLTAGGGGGAQGSDIRGGGGSNGANGSNGVNGGEPGLSIPSVIDDQIIPINDMPSYNILSQIAEIDNATHGQAGADGSAGNWGGNAYGGAGGGGGGGGDDTYVGARKGGRGGSGSRGGRGGKGAAGGAGGKGAPANPGGLSGRIIYITARNINLSGEIISNGSPGNDARKGGNGGSGGTGSTGENGFRGSDGGYPDWGYNRNKDNQITGTWWGMAGAGGGGGGGGAGGGGGGAGGCGGVSGASLGGPGGAVILKSKNNTYSVTDKIDLIKTEGAISGRELLSTNFSSTNAGTGGSGNNGATGGQGSLYGNVSGQQSIPYGGGGGGGAGGAGASGGTSSYTITLGNRLPKAPDGYKKIDTYY